MALSPTASLTQSSDCTQLFLTDTTGAYNNVSNLGGYGAPNTTLAQISSVTISGTIYLPGGSTITIPTTTIAPTVQNPIPIVLNEVYLLTTTLLGIVGTTFPDGIYVLTYTVVSSALGTSYPVTFQQMVTCNVDCSMGSMLATIDPCDCSCEGTEELFEIFMTLMAAKSAAGQTMNSKALDDLLVVQNYFLNQSTTCGCSE